MPLERQQMLDASTASSTLLRLAVLPLLVFVMAVPLLPALPLPIGSGISLVDWQRIVEIAALALSVVLLAGVLPAWRGEAVALGTLAACLALGVVSILAGDRAQRESWSDWLMWAELLLAGWGTSMAFARNGQRLDDLLLKAAAFGAAAFILWTLVINFIVFVAREPSRPPFVAILGFSSIRQFSDWQSFVLPFVPVAIASYARSRWLRAIAVVAAFLFYSLAFHAQSRSLFLGQLMAHVTLAVVLGRRYRPVLRQHGGYWLGGLGAYLLVRLAGWQEGMQSGMSGGLMREGLSRRDELWGYALQLSRTHPWLGVGPGRFSLYPNPISSSTHNAPLMLAAEWGWPVTLAVMASVSVLLWRAAKRLREPAGSAGEAGVGSPAAMAIWLATIALLAQSLVSGVVTAPASQVCLLLGMAWFAAVAGGDGIPRRVLMLRRPMLFATTAAVLLALGGNVAGDVDLLPQRNARFRACLPPNVLFSPRFWQQGWLFDPCDPAVVPILSGRSVQVPGIGGLIGVPAPPSVSAR